METVAHVFIQYKQYGRERETETESLREKGIQEVNIKVLLRASTDMAYLIFCLLVYEAGAGW